MSETKVNLGFRVSVDRQEELKISAAKRRLSLQKLMEEALDCYLGLDEDQSAVLAVMRVDTVLRQAIIRVAQGLSCASNDTTQPEALLNKYNNGNPYSIGK